MSRACQVIVVVCSEMIMWVVCSEGRQRQRQEKENMEQPLDDDDEHAITTSNLSANFTA